MLDNGQIVLTPRMTIDKFLADHPDAVSNKQYNREGNYASLILRDARLVDRHWFCVDLHFEFARLKYVYLFPQYHASPQTWFARLLERLTPLRLMPRDEAVNLLRLVLKEQLNQDCSRQFYDWGIADLVDDDERMNQSILLEYF